MLTSDIDATGVSSLGGHLVNQRSWTNSSVSGEARGSGSRAMLWDLGYCVLRDSTFVPQISIYLRGGCYFAVHLIYLFI